MDRYGVWINRYEYFMNRCTSDPKQKRVDASSITVPPGDISSL